MGHGQGKGCLNGGRKWKELKDGRGKDGMGSVDGWLVWCGGGTLTKAWLKGKATGRNVLLIGNSPFCWNRDRRTKGWKLDVARMVNEGWWKDERKGDGGRDDEERCVTEKTVA